jgi:hypothetical protein
MSKWQPIETAPKTGEPILLYQPSEGGQIGPNLDLDPGYYIFTGWFVRGHWYCCEYDAFEKDPTHWQPLPEPPK